jgi:pyruvate formate lyase activating enzyme
MEALVARIDTLAHHAFPGKAAAAVYLSGCNLKCPWCFVPAMVRGEGSRMGVEEIVEEALHFEPEAVVFDGGEPLLQLDALEELCSAFLSRGLLTKVQTNGTRPAQLTHLLSKKLLSRVGVDVKAPLDDARLYRKMCGVRDASLPEDVRKSLCACRAFKAAVDVTVPIIPSFNDKPRFLRAIARDVAPFASTLTLVEFDSRTTLDPRLQEIEPPSRDELHALARECDAVRTVRVRTREYGEEAA